MKNILIAALALGLAACGGGESEKAAGGDGPKQEQASGPRKGQQAPPLELENIVSGGLKPVKGWRDLSGKAVVLEFWGTFCHPCIENIPHMNELAEKFKDRPVVFISVSRERKAEVESFLKSHPMKGNVAAEAAGAFRAFRVNGVPHTVLVDKDGFIRAVSYPSLVTPESIEALLAGRPVPGDLIEDDGEHSASLQGGDDDNGA